MRIARAGKITAAALAVWAATSHHAARTVPPPGHAAQAAVAYAVRQIGKPYQWGGTGPGAFDCSGLAMDAYAAAGITLPRTSQEQWADGVRVASPEAGDLVYFAGADGTAAAPGHVGIVVNPAAHTMIDAYGTGTTVRYDTYGLPDSAPGLGGPVGFTDPGA